jgi:hypothetical protein
LVVIEIGYELNIRGIEVRFVARVRNFLYSIHTGFEAHAATYPKGTGGSFPGVKRSWLEADTSI